MLLAVAIFVVLVTSFFCSLSEASFLSSSRVRLHRLAAENRAARLIARLKEHPDRPIAAILILNTVANTGGAALAGREYQRTFEGANMGLFTVGLTLAVLVFSELLPKTLGVRHAMGTVLFVARPLWLLTLVMRPLTLLVDAVARGVGGKRAAPVNFSLEDLRSMAQLAVSSEALRREEQMIIEAASRLPRITVQQIMIHRGDIVYLSLRDDDDEILMKARRSMHSRVLLCRTDLDDCLGVTSVKEVLWRLVQEPEDREEDGLKRILGEAVREPLFVPADLEVTRLLNLFSREHEHLAVVRDKAGKIAGIITLEDVIEELIGEVDDEYDSSPRTAEEVEPGRWQLGGGMLWPDVAERLHLPVGEFGPDVDLDGRFDLNDFAADHLRGKLRTGGTFSVGKWRFRVARMRRGKVLYVEAQLLGASTSHGPEGKDSRSAA